jgi:glyoxylase-like metal-dependent hydrolase (beta-lactamase superfamily II)
MIVRAHVGYGLHAGDHRSPITDYEARMSVTALIRRFCVALMGTGVVSGLPSVASAQAPVGPRYQIYGVRIAQIAAVPTHYLVLGADTARRSDLSYVVWVLKGTGPGASGHTVLFDAGFYRDKFLKAWKPTDFMKPSEAVAKVSVRPEDVTDIIISHIHWDHVDGADLFPKARVWLQRAEYEHYVDAQGHPLARGIDTADAEMLGQLNRAGRIHLIDGDAQEIIPGITAYTGGRHTFASEYIRVLTQQGRVVLASDNVYMYENLAKHLPIAAVFTRADTVANLQAQDRMRQLASDPKFILPGHDPEIFVRFPSPGNGVAEIK